MSHDCAAPSGGLPRCRGARQYLWRCRILSGIEPGASGNARAIKYDENHLNYTIMTYFVAIPVAIYTIRISDVFWG